MIDMSTASKKQKFFTVLLVIALAFFIPTQTTADTSAQKTLSTTGHIQYPTNPEPAPPGTFIGLSGYPTSTSQIDAIIQVMDENNLNIFRMSFNPEWFGGKPHPYRANYIQYFLDNCDYYIIVERNHIYPPTEEGAQEARDNWDIVENSLFDVLETWPNNQRVMVELINEYVSSDFYPRMQDLVDSIRDTGYTNPIVMNKWNHQWTVINDPLDNTYQGYHFYFNSWSVSGATSQMETALSKGIKMINTEIGADFNEARDFDSSEVKELSDFISWCNDRGIGNTVWMNENLANWQTYQQLGITFP